MSSLKNYAVMLKNGYESAINRIRKKFDVDKGYLDEEYLARGREMNRETRDAKNPVSAEPKIGLSNVRDELLSKGLSESGESVNATIRSNLARNSDFARLDAEATRAHTENALSRSEALAKLISRKLDSEAALESEMLNAAREDARFEEELRLKEEAAAEDKARWEAEEKRKDDEAAEDRARWEAEEKAKEDASKDEKERWEKEFLRDVYESDREFEASEEQRKTENFYDAQRIAIAMENSDGESGGGSGTGSSVGKNENSPGGYVPTYDADELVEAIFAAMHQRYFPSNDARYAAIERAIYQVLNDTTLAPSYKAQVRVYASSCGYLNDF